MLFTSPQVSHTNKDGNSHLAQWSRSVCVCLCVCINGCYRTKSRAGIILSNLLAAGLGISGMLGASLSPLLSSLPASQMAHSILHSHSSVFIQTVSISDWCSNFLLFLKPLSLIPFILHYHLSPLSWCLFASFLSLSLSQTEKLQNTFHKESKQKGR